MNYIELIMNLLRALYYAVCDIALFSKLSDLCGKCITAGVELFLLHPGKRGGCDC